MEHLINAVNDLPAYIGWLLSGQNLVWFVLALFVYLICLFLNGTFASILRVLAVIALVADAVVSYVVYQNYPHVLIEGAAILLLIIVRLLFKGVSAARLNRKNRRFEKVALARAAMRRGEHKRDFGTAVGQDEENGNAASSDATLSRAKLNQKIAELEQKAKDGEITQDELSAKKAELYSKLG